MNVFGMLIFLVPIAIIVLIVVLIRNSSQKTRREFEVHKQQSQNSPSSGGYNQAPVFAQDAPSTGFAVLGFFFPVVGLILYLVWNGTLPFRARSAGKGALIGTIMYVVAIIIMVVVSVSLMSGGLF